VREVRAELSLGKKTIKEVYRLKSEGTKQRVREVRAKLSLKKTIKRVYLLKL